MIFLNSLLGKDRGVFPFMTQGRLRGKLKGNLRGILLWLCALQTPTKLKLNNQLKNKGTFLQSNLYDAPIY